jgi:hypothetical protein
MSDPREQPLTDDELDVRVRAASTALAALAPAGHLEGFADRIEYQLREIDLPGASSKSAAAMVDRTIEESKMTSDTDNKSGRDPITAKPPVARTEDSGLHDIKALAQDTRKRISRRITSQHDIDERLLSSSHSGLRAVALPDAAMVVAFPDVPTSMDEIKAATGAPAASAAGVATANAAVTPMARKRTRLWIGLGGAGLAAAAVVAIVVSSGGNKSSDDKPNDKQIASSQVGGARPAAPQSEEKQAATVPPPPTMAASGSGAVAMTGTATMAGSPPSDPGSGQTVTGGNAAGDTGSNARKPGIEGQKTTAAGHGPDARDGSSKPETRPGGGSGKTNSTDVKNGPGDTKPAGGAAGKPVTGAGSGSAKPTGGGDKSIEDLLNDASGGGTKPGGGGGDSAPTGPVKSNLEPKEIKAGMSSVAGKAQACFAQHGVAGHVKVKAVVSASGAVSKCDATGEFAGTPTGACVAAAVKGASFPSWTGAPMTVTYSFTLQE